METEELEDIREVIRGGNNIENLDETRTFDRMESLSGLLKNRVCENCKKFEKCIPLGQSVRRCQACAKRKDLIEKKPLYDLRGEELISEERLEMNDDSKDEPLIAATSKLVIEGNMTLEEQWNNNPKISCNENFAVEHEHVDMHSTDVVKGPNSISGEDGKVVKKKESTLSSKKEYKIVNAVESTVKREKFGSSKDRFLSEKDVPTSNERREQTAELLDAQKTKEEIELERRERGWIVNGRNASHSKQMQVKSVAISDGYSPGKDRREKVKVKTLKEKPDTQRILGLVAQRSESRISSPTHKRDTCKLEDEEAKAPYTTNIINNTHPSITSPEKNLETAKARGVFYENATHVSGCLTCNGDEGKKLNINVDEEAFNQQPGLTQQTDSQSKRSSPTNSNYYDNENPLPGTHRILELLAKRNKSRVGSPIRSLETGINEGGPILTKETELTEPKTRKTSVVLHSITLHDQQQTSCNGSGLSWNNAKEKVLNSSPNHGMGLDIQTHNNHQNMESDCALSTNTDCHFNDNPLDGTHRILGLIAQRSENNRTSPKQSFDSSTKDKFSIHMKENGFSKLDDTMNIINDEHSSCSKKNQDVTTSKITHLNFTSHNHNGSNKKKIEEQNNLKLQPKQDLSRQNSIVSNFSTPLSTICHFNDNPLYGTKFESEPSNCTFNNNDNHLHMLIPSLSLIAHDLTKTHLNNSSEGASKICYKEECSPLLLKNSLIYNTSKMTPLYKSAVATPMCKSPQPNQKKNETSFQVEFKSQTKEVEIIEEESFLTSIPDVQSKNSIKNDQEKIKKSNKKDEKYEQENNNLNNSNIKKMKFLEDTKDKLMKKANEEKELISHYDLKITSSKNASKGKIIFQPIHILSKSLTYPFKLVAKFILYLVYIFKTFVFGIIRPFKMLKNITLLGVNAMKSRILKHSQNECNNSQGYSSCGCVTKAYIVIMLSSLLLPNLFDLDFYLVNRFIEGQIIIREALNFDYTKEHPTAMVNLLPQQIIGKAKGYFPDREAMDAHAFPPSHVYHIVVHLTVPESQYNHEIGMFQVVAETFSARGHSLNKASRATMLRYHSLPVKYIKSLIMGIPIVLGLSQESQTLSIKVMESQNEIEHSPTASVCVDIEPKAGHLTGLGVPEIYHGELQVIAHNPYLREIARNWVWSLYLYSGLALFVFEVLLVLCCCRRIFPQKPRKEDTIERLSSKENKPILQEGQKNMQAPKRLHKRHIYFPKSLPFISSSASSIIECKSV